jgi:hypothetical protein
MWPFKMIGRESPQKVYGRFISAVLAEMSRFKPEKPLTSSFYGKAWEEELPRALKAVARILEVDRLCGLKLQLLSSALETVKIIRDSAWNQCALCALCLIGANPSELLDENDFFNYSFILSGPEFMAKFNPSLLRALESLEQNPSLELNVAADLRPEGAYSSSDVKPASSDIPLEQGQRGPGERLRFFWQKVLRIPDHRVIDAAAEGTISLIEPPDSERFQQFREMVAAAFKKDRDSVRRLAESLQGKPRGDYQFAKEAGHINSIGLVFDIDELGGGFYAASAWRVFMQHVRPETITGCSLKEGDTQETLSGRRREFCIAVEGSGLDIDAIRKTFEQSSEKGLASPNRRFIFSPQLDSEPLVAAGCIDAQGRIIQGEWNRGFHDRCKDCGWGYAPTSVPKGLPSELRAELEDLKKRTV